MICFAHLPFLSPGVAWQALRLPRLPWRLPLIFLHASWMTAVWFELLSRSLAWACRWLRYVSIGITPASASRTLVGVALNAPVIVRRHLFCMTFSWLMCFV